MLVDEVDGSAILEQINEDYAHAKTWYIDAIEEQTPNSDHSRSWDQTVRIGALAGAKYHYEGHTQFGSPPHCFPTGKLHEAFTPKNVCSLNGAFSVDG